MFYVEFLEALNMAVWSSSDVSYYQNFVSFPRLRIILSLGFSNLGPHVQGRNFSDIIIRW